MSRLLAVAGWGITALGLSQSWISAPSRDTVHAHHISDAWVLWLSDNRIAVAPAQSIFAALLFFGALQLIGIVVGIPMLVGFFAVLSGALTISWVLRELHAPAMSLIGDLLGVASRLGAGPALVLLGCILSLVAAPLVRPRVVDLRADQPYAVSPH